MNKSTLLQIALGLGLILVCALGSLPARVRADGRDESAPIVMNNLPAGNYTITTSAGPAITNVRSFVVMTYMGFKMLNVITRVDGKDHELWLNPEHVISIKHDENQN